MKKIKLFYACLFFFLLPALVSAQNYNANYISHSSSLTISLSKKVKDKISFPFSSVQFLDSRMDNSGLGFYQFNEDSFGRYIFKNSLITELENYFANNFSPSTNKEDSAGLLIAIKKFWVSDIIQDTVKSFSEVGNKYLLIDAEVYTNINGNYNALFHIDTTMYASNRINLIEAPACLEGVKCLFNKCIQNRNKNTNKVKKKFLIDEIISHLNKRFDIPILLDTNKSKGVFYTFSDFKKNTPTPDKFIFGEQGLMDHIYLIAENGDSSFLRNFWGLCDGKNYYINYRHNIFPVIKCGNVFYILGRSNVVFKYSRNYLTNVAIGIGLRALTGNTASFGNPYYQGSVIKDIQYYPLQLDWDTGEFY